MLILGFLGLWFDGSKKSEDSNDYVSQPWMGSLSSFFFAISIGI